MPAAFAFDRIPDTVPSEQPVAVAISRWLSLSSSCSLSISFVFFHVGSPHCCASRYFYNESLIPPASRGKRPGMVFKSAVFVFKCFRFGVQILRFWCSSVAEICTAFYLDFFKSAQ
jgi:hypothetical protein